MISAMQAAVRRPRRRGARRYGDLRLPRARSNQGLRSNADYVASAVGQVKQVLALCEDPSRLRLLDFGCGQGRLANGFMAHDTRIASYHGIDTAEPAIEWCRRWIGRTHPEFVFTHLPARNDRYNPRATGRLDLPLPDSSVSFVFLNSVFSHMRTDDVSFYAAEFDRVLEPGGLVYATAFVEEDVPDEQENPPDYFLELGRPVGALHRVRFERHHFVDVLQRAGLSVLDIRYREIERTGQSVIIARSERLS